MTLWMVCICPEGAMFEIWLKSDKFEGIKNIPKDDGGLEDAGGS